MNGFTLARIVGALHAHKGGGVKSTKVYELLIGLDSLIERIGEDALRGNVIRFFDAIDRCWTIRNLSGGREARPHLKPAFMMTIAQLLSSYADFWDGMERNDFYFPDKFIKKLRAFKLASYLSAAARGIPKAALYEILRKQLSLDPIYEERAAAE